MISIKVMGVTRNSFQNCQLTGMSADSVPQSYSRPFLWAVYNAHAVRAPRPRSQPSAQSKLNIERFYQAKPVNAGEARLRVKAASTLSFARLPKAFGKLPRMSGSFDF